MAEKEKINEINIAEDSIGILKKDMETFINRSIQTPSDFTCLSEFIFERSNENISESTLKRLWGYNSGYKIVRRHTLDVLTRTIGYKDWDDYCRYKQVGSIDTSIMSFSQSVKTEEMEEGEMLEVRWRPDRRCILEYIGKEHFKVIKSENSKLNEGDTFRSAIFILGEPAYLDDLQHDGESGLTYIAGKKGITQLKIVEKANGDE
jgi:hypothetical protein